MFATAIGLFAAIPALIFFNKLQGVVAKNQARMESFADEFSSILSRQIDQQSAASATARPDVTVRDAERHGHVVRQADARADAAGAACRAMARWPTST